MNKKILLGLGLVLSLAASAAFASDSTAVTKDSSTMHHHAHMHQDRYHKHGFFAELKYLKLTTDQKNQIHSIMQDEMKSMPHLSDAFSDNGFDKAKYIQIEQQKRDKMIERKADMIEKIYNILDDSQKKALKQQMLKHQEHSWHCKSEKPTA